MKKKKVVFIAMNAKYFRFRELITKFVFEHDAIPVNSLMLYGYYLYDMVPRVKIIEAYKTLVPKCDELWAFGEISDGIRDGMVIARKNNIPVRFFDISKFPANIYEINENQIVYEEGISFG